MKKSAASLLVLLIACGDRNEFWDTPLGSPQVIGLEGSVALIDAPADRAFLLRRRGDQLLRQVVPVGRNLVASAATPDRRRVALLAAGDAVQDEPDDPAPQLTLLDAPASGDATVRVFPLEVQHSGVALDPRGEFAVVHAAPNAESGWQLAENPNELIFFDLRTGAHVTRSLRSFGGKPKRFTFTPPLGLPGGARRLLIVETEQDLAFIDLEHLDRPEISVRLTSGLDARVVRPEGVVFDDGDPQRDDDTRVAVRVDGGGDVITLTLQPAPNTPNGFTPFINLASVGGTVSDLSFVQTDAGLRVAALVPAARKAVLIEPDTSRTVDVDLGASLSKISLAGGDPNATTASAAGDVALLYGAEGSSSVGFWSFRQAPERPYRTVEILPLPSAVGAVYTLAGRPNARIAVGASSLFVLDLEQRTASPLSTAAGARLHVAADGGRMWVYQPNGTELAAIDAVGLGLARVQLQRTFSSVFDVADEGGGRSLFAVDANSGGAVTVVDALNPNPAEQLHAAGLFLTDAP